MGGILKNKQERSPSDARVSDSTKEFREQVLKNTKLNALLKSEHHVDLSTHHSSDAASSNNNNNNNNNNSDDKLQWNKKNLSENEIIQKNIMENMAQTIDEPKTPFQKATQPELNEYYQDDDDDEKNDLDDFSLGDPEFKVDELDKLQKDGSADIPNQQSEVVVAVDAESEPEPKKSFEELRKEHYHNEHFAIENPLTNKVVENDDADDEKYDEEEEDSKGKKSFDELRKQHYHREFAPKLGQTFDDEGDDDDEEE